MSSACKAIPNRAAHLTPAPPSCSKNTRFLDLKPATDASCGAFISVATPLSGTTAVAVVLGFAERADCTSAAIRAAKMLLHMASTRCRDSVVNILAVTEMLVAPPPLPQLRHPDDEGRDGDGDEEDLVEEEWELSGRGSGEHPPLRNPAHPLTLRFPAPDMEAAFAAWHNHTLTRMDAFGFAMCGCSLLFILFIPHTAWDRAFRVADISPWRGAVSLLPALLLASPRTRPFYARHREAIVAYIFACVLQWTLHVAHYMHCMEPAAFIRPLHLHGFSWVGVLALLFQVRWRLLAPLVLACFAADAGAMMPTICATFYPTTAPAACMGLDLVRVGLLAITVPLALARVMELRARELFLARLQRE